MGDVRVDDAIFDESTKEFDASSSVIVSQFGIPRTPEDFLKRAVKCGHPRGMSIHLPEVVQQVLSDNLEMEPSELALHRCRQLAKWAMRAQRLNKDEI